LQWYTEEFAVNAQDKILVISSFGFDLTQKNLFTALIKGGTLVLPEGDSYDDQYYVDLITQQGISFINCAPSAFYPLVQGCNDLSKLASLRVLLFGGEPIHLAQMAAWINDTHFHCEVVNMYGPTECTDIATYQRIRDVKAQLNAQDLLIPIGRPNANVQLYLVNEHNQLLPPGVAGELCITGEGVGVGYLKRGQLTGEKFKKNPFGTGLMYRTGDLVRFVPGEKLPEARLEYLNRIDFQVKVRGLRIELGEIQFALRQLAGVEDAMVLVKDDSLIAYVVGREQTIDTQTWRSQLGAYLPEYMLPNHLVTLAHWPLTPNGKIDRQALLAMSGVSALTAHYIAPASEIEKIVADIWADLLNVEKVGVHDNFFELGGHSLLATQVAARVRATFNVEISLRGLFDMPTVMGVVHEVQRMQRLGNLAKAPALVALPRNSDGEATELPLSFAQQRLWFIDQLQPGNAAYNMPIALRIEGELDLDIMTQVFNELVKRHEGLRTVFITEDGQGKQVIQPTLNLAIEIEDISALTGDVQQHEARRLVEAEASKPFNLQTGPLFRTRLLKLSGADPGAADSTAERQPVYILMATMHHIIADGWSLNLLTQELGVLYMAFSQGLPSPLPPTQIQYADFAAWQREWLQGEALETQIHYWRDNLRNVPPLDLPTDKLRPPLMTFGGATYEFQIPMAVGDRLRKLSIENGATLFMTLLTAFNILIGRDI